MPVLNRARKMVLLAVELPEPFLVPTIMEKSFTTLFMMLLINVMESLSSLTKAKPRNSKFTVFDTTGQYERSAPHILPCNLHYRSTPPSADDSAILLVN